MTMLPEEFLERIKKQSYIDGPGLADAFNRPSATSIRVNRRKWLSEVTGYEKVEWEPDGYYLPGRTPFTPDPLFHAGVYYPQESSSMFAGEFFRQLTGGVTDLRVLDLCGAPGGKATHLSAILGENGLLVANEVIRARSTVLAENITKWGIGNTVVTQNDPVRFASLPGFFDVIVADAPCSGEGMFRNPAVVGEWSPQNAMMCSERQRRIIMDAWPSLRPGGTLIYSTCTFNPAENEENIAWIRDTTGSEPLTAGMPGLNGAIADAGTENAEGGFHGITTVCYKAIQCYGFHPGRVRGEGFFIAALRKPAAASGSPGNQMKGLVIRHGRNDILRPSPIAFSRSGQLADFGRDRVIMSGNRIIALAAETDLLGILSEKLTVIKSGTMIGELKNDDLVPAHDLAMSVRQRRGVWPEYELTYDKALAYLRLEMAPEESMPRGRVLVNYRGVPLGFVNNLGNRLNNGYPQSWRIRMEKQQDFSHIL